MKKKIENDSITHFDFALLELAGTLNFSDTVQLVSLPGPDFKIDDLTLNDFCRIQKRVKRAHVRAILVVHW